MTDRPLLDRLRSLGLPAGDFAVFGSGPLWVRGIIDSVNDLDVICRGRAWEAVSSLGEPVFYDDGVEVRVLDGGRISFGRRWALGEFDLDVLIDTAEVFDGLPFVRLEHVVAYKLAAGRPKDLEHLAALAAWEGDAQ